MKLKNKFLLGILTVSMMCMILQPNISNAALQSNGGTPATKNASDWILQIRQMQELGGTLGRKDTVNTSDLTSDATDLDIHMEKNSEYGAMVILSASAYGNPNKIEDGGTTTGNSTGIVMNINTERVATATSTSVVPNFASSAMRYKNLYDYTYAAKIGDALTETSQWHGGDYRWYDGSASANYDTIVRSFSGSVFSYSAYGSYGRGGAYYEKLSSSRACIVVGTGI